MFYIGFAIPFIVVFGILLLATLDENKKKKTGQLTPQQWLNKYYEPDWTPELQAREEQLEQDLIFEHNINQYMNQDLTKTWQRYL